jgi:hypothetical protein
MAASNGTAYYRDEDGTRAIKCRSAQTREKRVSFCGISASYTLMNAPPLTLKTGLVFLLGVALVLFCVYLWVSALINAKPQQRVHPNPPPANVPAPSQ